MLRFFFPPLAHDDLATITGMIASAQSYEIFEGLGGTSFRKLNQNPDVNGFANQKFLPFGRMPTQQAPYLP
jgi:hypothetical protein